MHSNGRTLYFVPRALCIARVTEVTGASVFLADNQIIRSDRLALLHYAGREFIAFQMSRSSGKAEEANVGLL